MATYETYPIETDPDALAEDAFSYLQDRWPGWLPSPGNFDAGTVEAHARMVAELRDVAASVPDEIFVRFGTTLSGVPPLEATAAVLAGTVTAIDTQGYTLPAGTAFGARAAGDELVIFETDTDVAIPAGSTSSAVGLVTLTAQEEGALANNLAGVGYAMELVDVLPWVNSLVTTTAATGGADDEDTAVYLDRLATELQLQTPRPILARDFAILAQRDPNVDRALAVDLYQAGTNERQTVSHNGTSGALTLTRSGQTTAALDWNASTVAIRAALEALPAIGLGNVDVSGGPWPSAVVVEFKGALGESDQPAMTADASGLAPGGSTVTITTTQAGAPGASGVARCLTVIVVDENGEDPGALVRTRIRDSLLAMREATFLVYVLPAAYVVASVSFTAVCLPNFTPDDVLARAEAAVTDYLSPASWGLLPYSDERIWLPQTRVRITELVEVLNSVDGLWYVETGTVLINGAAADLVLAGRGPLPRAGTVTGVVTQG